MLHYIKEITWIALKYIMFGILLCYGISDIFEEFDYVNWITLYCDNGIALQYINRIVLCYMKRITLHNIWNYDKGIVLPYQNYILLMELYYITLTELH